MKEPVAILEGFDALSGEGKSAALATVVRVVGSGYRRPGAKMLVAGDGRTWGGISGGCLERDVIRRARNLIGTNQTVIARYDTTDESCELGESFSLGCQGVIDVFVEPVSEASAGPIAAIRRATIDRRPVAVATVIRSNTMPAGTRILFESTLPAGCPCVLNDDLRKLLQSGEGSVRKYESPDGMLEVFYELIRSPQSLVIFGGGPDVVPLLAVAKLLGWHVTVVRSAGVGPLFDLADVVAVGTDENPMGGITIERDAAVVVMTHNYRRDGALLPILLAAPLRYLGVLGPGRRTERLVGGSRETMNRLFAPIGLDLGADTPETIALAIVSEIQAVLAGRPAQFLRDRPGPIYIHADSDAAARPFDFHACPRSA